METSLRSIGNSKGAVIPAQLLKELNINVGDKLDARAENGALIITLKHVKPKYLLDELLAKCDESAPMPQTLVDWDNAQPVGEEL
ncbi:MAG: AbrB/MazE/SpoVT family DNA-binding domain-containing protein [Algicola sp.]|nr:AbrB/MazE/SpoVT family DNA-binding domain-containing protein [Algicola sp.]